MRSWKYIGSERDSSLMLKLCSKLTTLYKGFLGNIWKYIWDIWDSLLVLKLCCGVCQTNWIRRQRYILVITLPRTLKSKRNFVYKRSTSSKKPLSKHCIVWMGVDLSIPIKFSLSKKRNSVPMKLCSKWVECDDNGNNGENNIEVVIF